MLNLQFVGVVCGPFWNHSVSFAQPLVNFGLPSWKNNPDRVPPDPVKHPFHFKTLEHPSVCPLEIIDKPNKCIYSGFKTNILYQACQKNVRDSKRGALVDRGANGGLAGSDVRVITVSICEVDVQGIDNHQLTNIPIVTAAGVVETQKGPIVLILNQYAHVKHGKTIHSSAQMEANGVEVDDRAIPKGGHQRIIAQGGYVIPLQVRSGLVYMDMRPPTDEELAIPSKGGLPQVIVTSDLDWHPSSVDFEHDAEQWFDAMQELPDLDHDLPFDDYGEYLHGHELEATYLNTFQSNNTVQSQAQARTIDPSPTDFEALQPKFGWLPIDVIRDTFAITTQFYRTRASTHLKKHIRSPYPACNVHRRQEAIATDTVYSDTPAIDDGSKVTQIFVGTTSLVTDIYGMKTAKQFVNTLQDVIRTRGAQLN